jgi:DNA polymerase elongation subunit (family B)
MLQEPLLSGANQDAGLVAVEHLEDARAGDSVVLFTRQKEIIQTRDTFSPFLFLVDRGLIEGMPVDGEIEELQGSLSFRWRMRFKTWKACMKAKMWLGKATGKAAGHPDAPYFLINDPVQQYLMFSGRTLFKGLRFDDVRRMQVDIECYTSEGFEFCNAEREGDRIIAIALSDNKGWTIVLSGAELDERSLIGQFVALVQERDPDVIEGHNIFNFDLPYLNVRAKRHGVKLTLGRNGSVPETRPSRFSVGERTIAYTRFDVFGRHVVDTMFLVHAYDVTHRSLESHGLKSVAKHFGLSRPGRVHIEGSEISAEFRRDPSKVMSYAGDDVRETEALSRLLSQSAFAQAQVIPFSYQNICVRGNATRIDALILREYFRQGHSLPAPDRARPFAGGYADMYLQGVLQNVHHCDIRSLYPSLMLARRIGPRHDVLGVFLQLLIRLRQFRLEAKGAARAAKTEGERLHHEALQTTFKVLINSFYGYLGFDQARFSDFDAAERVASEGRDLLRFMINWLESNGARPVEMDTDGIYFIPPSFEDVPARDAFRLKFEKALPPGLEVEFDGEYAAMFSYKVKNYALLERGGGIIIKGAALKSRGLEPFQRKFLKELIRLKLEGRDDALPALKAQYEHDIVNRVWPVTLFAKTETLQDSLATYAGKIGQKSRARNAAYELALASGREYRAGDQVSYYVTGSRKSVPVHSSSRLVSGWNPFERDENVAYYVSKLDALYEKFCGGALGGEEAGEN